jgi:hypothetical protein
MRKLVLTLALGAFAAGACLAKASPEQPDAKGEAELAKLLAGRAEGPPERCITTMNSVNPRIVDGTAIVYDFGRTLYVNRPRGNLTTLREDDLLVSQQWGSQLCALDQVRTVEPGSGFPHSIMTLGEFVPYARPAKTKK